MVSFDLIGYSQGHVQDEHQIAMEKPNPKSVFIKLFITGEIKTCCDADQIMTMSTEMEIANVFLGRCPTCVQNLFNSICLFTCAPDQSRFMRATKITDGIIKSIEVRSF